MSFKKEQNGEDEIMSDSNTPLSSSTDTSSVELKKRKSTTESTNDFSQSGTSGTAGSTTIGNDGSLHQTLDFSHVSNQILPPLDEEEILDKGSYTWEISNYRALNEAKVRGPRFTVGDIEWNILLFPRGNANQHLALYLEPIQPKKLNPETGEEEPLDPNWYCCAQFTLILSNPNNSKNCVLNTSHQRFNKDATDWGFSNFTELKNLYQPRKDHAPLIWEDRLHITAFVKVLKDPTGVLWHNFIDYDSKKQTGFVGFKNQGATCYLNSLLQSYFFTRNFRKAVYQIPTEGEDPNDSVALALQRIFYQLQQSPEPLDTTELTKSFGWDTGDAFTQHDVQELNRILMDKLETRMKGTIAENSLNNTFVGKMKSYIKCINVDYESARTEDFWDIQLNVKNLVNLTQSFQNYVEVELMNGENQYAAQDYGLQDAKKGVIFESFPNVLHLQLKRFEYDFNYDQLVKINDRHEFPESIDLSPYLEHEGGANPDPLIYDLHGVLVHAGDISTGHYYALIKPDKSNQWYRFDDDKVWKVTRKQVFDENFGCDALDNTKLAKMTRLQYQQYQLRRHTSAYMLVYIKRSELDNVLPEVTEKDVPKYIVDEVQRELEERERQRKELEESYLYLNIHFYTNRLFKHYEGFDLGASERLLSSGPYTDADQPITLKILKEKKFTELLPELKELLNIDVEKVNFWIMNYRRNQTLRPSSKLQYDDLTVGEIYEKYLSKKHSFANFWIEEPEYELNNQIGETSSVAESNNNNDIVDAVTSSETLLMFLKYFDPETQSLKGLTHFYTDSDDTLESLIPKINKFLGFKQNQELDLFEEIQPNSIEVLIPSNTFYKSELSNGDIITVQKSILNQNQQDLLSLNSQNLYPFYSSANLFYEYMRTRVYVKAQPLVDTSNDDEYVVVNTDENSTNDSKNSADQLFDFWISTHAAYEELAIRISKVAKVDHRYLRIFVNYNGNRIPLRTDMMIGNVTPKSLAGLTPLFEYEVLNISLNELENMKSIKVHWLTSGYIHYQVLDILIPKTGTVQDLIDKLQHKLGFDEKDKDKVLVWSNVNFKFYHILYPEVQVSSLENTLSIFAAILPEEVVTLDKQFNAEEDEELNATEAAEAEDKEVESERLVPVLQFNKDPSRLHGISFIFNLIPGEKLSDTKLRLQKKFGLGTKEFSKVSLCTWDAQFRKPSYLEDDDLITYDEVTESDFLCMDHPNRTSRQGSLQGGGISIK